ncbi:unnamed protein product [Caenorhabditis auriculariae]|uniref:Apple domain-containing protein n=1 Tax=Caenorhabditis auriculariae TaxID=2777116 RepID=A0A8S1HNG1_9PELO|nr:unnamed protein product [Caenorhabditis auriculariae]
MLQSLFLLLLFPIGCENCSYLLTQGYLSKSTLENTTIYNETTCLAFCENRRGCWGFTVRDGCYWFNETTNVSKGKKNNDGPSFVWLMLNYNFTDCGMVPTVLSKYRFNKHDLQDAAVETEGLLSELTSVSFGARFGNLGSSVVHLQGFTVPSYNICIWFNATVMGTEVLKTDDGSKYTWLMLNYNLTECVAFEDVKYTFQLPYTFQPPAGYLPHIPRIGLSSQTLMINSRITACSERSVAWPVCACGYFRWYFGYQPANLLLFIVTGPFSDV